MNKYIFLDIDGVVCTVRTRFGKLDQKCLRKLYFILWYTDAKIVVSSTWRARDTGETKKRLIDHGFSMRWHHRIISQTPHYRNGVAVRGNEIMKWLKDNNSWWDFQIPTRYVIFDDDSDMLLWQKRQFVKTDAGFGLSWFATLKAVWKLQVPEIKLLRKIKIALLNFRIESYFFRKDLG